MPRDERLPKHMSLHPWCSAQHEAKNSLICEPDKSPFYVLLSILVRATERCLLTANIADALWEKNIPMQILEEVRILCCSAIRCVLSIFLSTEYRSRQSMKQYTEQARSLLSWSLCCRKKQEFLADDRMRSGDTDWTQAKISNTAGCVFLG